MKIVKICFLTILAIFLLFTGCKKRDSNLVSKKVMQQLLVDLYLMDATYISRQSFPKDLDVIDSSELYGPIFEKYHITRSQFDSTIFYLTKRPEELDELYSDVIQELTKMEANVRIEMESDTINIHNKVVSE